jgi:hypothetical protein
MLGWYVLEQIAPLQPNFSPRRQSVSGLFRTSIRLIAAYWVIPGNTKKIKGFWSWVIVYQLVHVTRLARG